MQNLDRFLSTGPCFPASTPAGPRTCPLCGWEGASVLDELVGNVAAGELQLPAASGVESSRTRFALGSGLRINTVSFLLFTRFRAGSQHQCANFGCSRLHTA